jgi:hypothetical protein
MLGLIGAMLAVNTGVSSAVHDEDFELDGNTADDASPDADWETLFDATGTRIDPLPAGFVDAGFSADFALPDPSAYATGTKDTLPVDGGWQCKRSNNLGDKFDLVNAYTTAFRNADGHLIVYFGSEISSPNGARNAGFWLLQDDAVGCSSAGGGNTDFDGQHRDGDLLVVAAFSNGGAVARVLVFEWVDPTPANGVDDGSLNPTPVLDETAANCAAPAAADEACAIVNTGATVDPPWPHPDKNGGALDINEFAEGGVDLTAVLGEGNEPCIAKFLANSRSSFEPGSTLHDFAVGELETCGDLIVEKYIDVDMSRTHNTGDVDTANADLADWHFTVVRDSTGQTVCEGDTNNDGRLVCSTGSLENVPVGDYTVTESNNKADFFNTDPGDTDAFNNAPTAVKHVTVSGTDQTVEFGNTCYVDKTFTINAVPTGAQAPDEVTVDWSVASGPRAGLTRSVSLTQQNSTATGAQTNTFTQQDVIAWTWHTGDPSNAQPGSSGESLSGSGYPTCLKANSATFPRTTLTGLKFKDADADGVRDAGEPGIGGFTFQLKQGATVVATATSAANGTFSFPNVAPGDYTVSESGKPPGWLQTAPAGNSHPVTVTLGDTTGDAGTFGNTPLSKIDVTFTPLTSPASTTSSITCTGPAQPPGAGPLPPGADTDGSYTGNNLVIGTYTCTVTITDP